MSVHAVVDVYEAMGEASTSESYPFVLAGELARQGIQFNRRPSFIAPPRPDDMVAPWRYWLNEADHTLHVVQGEDAEHKS